MYVRDVNCNVGSELGKVGANLYGENSEWRETLDTRRHSQTSRNG